MRKMKALACSVTLVVASVAAAKPPAIVARGEHLVLLGGCNDCHTPLKMGPQGPAPDLTRMLSGHPQELAMPPPPRLAEGPWTYVAAATMTAWSGPWGVSYTSNLTPDADTGLGKWTAQNFIEAMRSGRHMGRGRPILPPMPVQALAKLSDAELKAIFAYLRTIPAIKNRVPDPVAPGVAAAQPVGGESGAPPGSVGTGSAEPSERPASPPRP